tara:strand:+ start:333 stop:968 length:636 start_codon:yes stop_codon:yes gene_type:complete
MKMINEKININIFDKWVLKNKDEGMEKGHASSVNSMVEIIKRRTKILNSKFNFLDLGCGNGWVVRKFSNNKSCNLAVGVDGSKNMIIKAKSYDPKGAYFKSNIESWNTKNKFNIIFSMETFYYLKNIDNVLNKINSDLLLDNGFLIIGIDHYYENKPSLTWEDDIGIQTHTLTIKQWIGKFEKANFKNINFTQVGFKKDWSGTLIISGFKG